MFGLPAETLWAFLPWPFLWFGLALFMYFKLKKEDDWEDRMTQDKKGGE